MEAVSDPRVLCWQPPVKWEASPFRAGSSHAYFCLSHGTKNGEAARRIVEGLRTHALLLRAHSPFSDIIDASCSFMRPTP
jgi:hypothetical protein